MKYVHKLFLIFEFHYLQKQLRGVLKNYYYYFDR